MTRITALLLALVVAASSCSYTYVVPESATDAPATPAITELPLDTGLIVPISVSDGENPPQADSAATDAADAGIDPAETALAASPAGPDDDSATANNPTDAATEQPPAQSQELYLALVDSARRALTERPLVHIDFARGSRWAYDLSFGAGVTIDRATNHSRVVYSFVAPGWDKLHTGSGINRTPTGGFAQYVYDGAGTVYFTSDPLPPGATVETPWHQAQIDLQWPEAQRKGAPNPVQAVHDLDALLALDLQPQRVDETTFKVNVSNVEIWDLLPGSWAMYGSSIGAMRDKANNAPLPVGKTPMVMTFEDGVLIKLEIDFGPLHDQLPSGDGRPNFSQRTHREVYEISYATNAPVLLPDVNVAAAEPTSSAGRTVDVVGACYTDSELGKRNRVASPCTESHIAEVFYTGRYGDSAGLPYPGDQALLDRAVAVCEDQLRTIVATIDRTMGIHVTAPYTESWDQGDRSFTCLAVHSASVTTRLANS